MRKEYDEKFLESRGIGEETDDPLNVSDEDNQEENKDGGGADVLQTYPRFSVAYRAMPAPVSGNTESEEL